MVVGGGRRGGGSGKVGWGRKVHSRCTTPEVVYASKNLKICAKCEHCNNGLVSKKKT